MNDIRSIEKTIDALPPSEFAGFRRWFAEFDVAAWDKQIEHDAASGKLDAQLKQGVKMPSDVENFQNDLLESVRQMGQRQAVSVTKVKATEAAEARALVGLSQQEFALLLGVSARTLQDWEQGRREPTGAAKTLLRVAVSHPEILRELHV